MYDYYAAMKAQSSHWVGKELPLPKKSLDVLDKQKGDVGSIFLLKRAVPHGQIVNKEHYREVLRV